MKSLVKLLAVTALTAAVGGSASAQFLPTPVRPALPGGVRVVPTSPPSFTPAIPVHPGWGSGYTPRPYPNPGPFPPTIDIDYKVYYRDCHRSPWQYYGRAETLREARFLERRLEAQGYQVNLVEKFGSGYDYRR
jgi:hypothetical protein